MSLRIGGNTKLAGVIGWPLGHTLSPAMHNAAYEALGLNMVYVPLPVEEEAHLFRLASAAKVLPSMVGFNVTMPHKEAMLSLCDEVAMLAEIAGAVNTVHCLDGRLIGYNTDGRGLLESLEEEASFRPEGKKIALFGAGGAAGAALAGFVLDRAQKVTVINRTVERAEALAGRMQTHARATEIDVLLMAEEAADVVREADLVVNATPVGMSPDDPSPVPASWLHSGQVVADMIYRAGGTALLAAAGAAGAVAVGGLGMLVAQGATAIEIWDSSIQVRAPRDVMRAAAEAALAGLGERVQGAGA